ncbi:uncharacterized protein CIMG_12630 [Coccidioides immitis RS]|uniref:Uncharacterized protein n=1 Tax=Coccidioides immitis (strain RS) TaxID=246410 RepID=A0A0D8JSJ2_COCIM|nr:uncharacterized protein CIMG_12630 [Coccidioides immitis RS]KJF59951.1 hypothetical protein CIMG_12630 [Coccidioides immitis RS]
MTKENLVLDESISFANLAMSELQALCYSMEPMVYAKRSDALCYSGSLSPSGHSNCYTSVPYQFPTAIQLQGLGAISDALVECIRWDNPMIIEKLNILFGSDDKKAQDFINNWHLKATQIALDAIIKTYQIEKKAFGNKSYWHCVHNNIDPVSVQSSPSSENLMEEENHNDHY